MLDVKQLRKKAGLSIHALAGKLGVAESTVSRWEAGKMNPKTIHYLKLIDIFGSEVRQA